MLDRRQSIRRRTLLDGRIEIERLNGWQLECAVRNLSETGACIELSVECTVPQTFELAVSTDVPRAARLVWYRDRQAGIAFAA